MLAIVTFGVTVVLLFHTLAMSHLTLYNGQQVRFWFMEAEMDVELGVPVATAVSGDSHVSGSFLPAGRYAALVYTGIENGIKGNAALLDWGAKKGLVWDTWEAENGDGFGARVEFFLTDPEDEPDQAKWETEVAIRLADNQP